MVAPVGGGSAGGASGRRRVCVGAGVVLLLAATCLGLVGVARGVTEWPNTDPYFSETLSTPVDTTLGLRAGGHYVYENTGPRRPGDDERAPVRGERPVTLTRDSVVVTGPDGEEVRLDAPGEESIGVGDDVFLAIAFLRVHEDGAYRLRVAAPDGATAQVYVQDDGYAVLLGRDAYAMVPVVLGVLVAAVGIGVLAYGFRRRPPGPVRAAAGWYPAPGEPQRVRYFDGVRWTNRDAGPPGGPAGRDR